MCVVSVGGGGSGGVDVVAVVVVGWRGDGDRGICRGNGGWMVVRVLVAVE